MDNLTHGLLGASIAAWRRGDRRTQQATLWACVLAAELPDLDLLLPAENPALHALSAHRGLSHALVFAPVWAGIATAVGKALFREVRALPLFGFTLLTVLLAHLAADAWTGWGTRLLLPFSDQRVTWDWMLVVDPVFSVPLILGAAVALVRRRWWRPALITGLLVATAYLGARVGTRAVLLERVRDRYPAAEQVAVFPGWLGIVRWRYVAVAPEQFAVGELGLGRELVEQAAVSRSHALSAEWAAVPTVAQALAWARFPAISAERRADGGATVRVADLRYHLGGAPTLQFVIQLSPGLQVEEARLDRGGTARELMSRWSALGR
ncbi:MAG: metal-dependent hydrolase [Myxococcota bacterium]|nr:metal-dependent hydrolase [Myxococcota bacterium]